MFIKLTTLQGKPYWVNPDHVSTINVDNAGDTALGSVFNNEQFFVKETPEQVVCLFASEDNFLTAN